MKEPPGHWEQFPSEVPPAAFKNLPLGQGVQLVCPAEAAKKPGRHTVQVRAPAPALTEPSGHGRQLASEVAEGWFRNLPWGQGVQAADPGALA